MASNQNCDSFGILFGSSLVGAKGFLKSRGVYLGSAFGTSTPKYTPNVKGDQLGKLSVGCIIELNRCSHNLYNSSRVTFDGTSISLISKKIYFSQVCNILLLHTVCLKLYVLSCINHNMINMD